MSFYRVQSADRDVTQLLAADLQTSEAWYGVDVRDGVSVCESREALARYLAGPGAGLTIGAGEWVLVELDGEVLPAAGLDAAHGELLVRPTRIVSVAPIDDAFFELIGQAYAELGA